MRANLLPHSEEAEKALLGAIILKPNKIYDVINAKLTPEDFYFQKHQAIFQAMLSLNKQNLPIDPVQLITVIKSNEGPSQSTAEVLALAEDCYSTENASSYAKIIREKSILRRFFQTFRSLSEQALDAQDTEEFIQSAQSTFLSALPERLQQEEKSLAEGMHEYLQRVESLTPDNPDLGFKTGFRDFDDLTQGLRKGQLIIFAGRPAMGKSAFSTSIVLNRMKMMKDSSIFIFSMEMTDDEIAERSFSGLARIDGSILKGGKLQAKHWNLLTSAHQLANQNKKITICSIPNITTAEIRSKCQQKLIKDKSLDLVVVDYLQLITSRGKRSDRSKEQEISDISRDLKNLAKELKVPVIALSQLNRESENREGNRPRMSDLRYSGSLEQDADLVCLLYRDEVYNPKTEEPGIAEITIAKQRNGRTGMFKVSWNNRFTLFENCDSQSNQASPVKTGPFSVVT